MNKIRIYILCLFFAGFVIGCVNTEVKQTTSPISTPTIVLISKAPTPTPRTFMYDEAIDCENPDVPGHLFFLSYNPNDEDRAETSQYDLYVSDGNGCSPRFVMEKVSGSPAWSKDGKYLAIGCENNQYLCILDVKVTLDTCKGSVTETGECIPAIHSKYKLPLVDVFLHNMWWSPDGTQIIVKGSDGQGFKSKRYTYTLILHGNGKWEPTSQQLICPELFLSNNDWTNEVTITDGRCPEKSQDGNKIAYARDAEDGSKETYGIGVFDLETNTLEWAYQPVNKDRYYWPPQNIYIGEFDGAFHRILSWSPDSRYIAFVVEGLLGQDDHQILRLDLDTGKIVRLTTRLITPRAVIVGRSYYRRYLAPAWGP